MDVKILSIDDLNDGDVGRLFFRARSFATDLRNLNKGSVIVMTAFFEPSTRTKLSFATASLRLGFDILNFDPESSSLKKQESFEDTLRTLASLGIDLLITRTSRALEEQFIRTLPCSFINAGDGINEHPTQALLDCFTLLQAWRCDDFCGKKILIIGDVAHSRVARSNLKLMRRLGAEVAILAPSTFLLSEASEKLLSYERFKDLPNNFDAVMVLRIQKERLEDPLLFSDIEYFRAFGMSKKRLDSLGPQCLILHPGPINISIEIDEDAAYGPNSLIKAQVQNGVYVRAALMEYCCC